MISSKSLLLTVGMVIAVVSPSFADSTVTFQLSPSGAGNYEGVVINAPGMSNFDAATGTYVATVNGVSYNVFCVDPNDEINWGQSYPTYTGETINAPASNPDTPVAVSTPGVNGGTSYYYNGGLASALTTSDEYRNAAAGTAPSSAVTQEISDEVGYLAGTYLNNTNTNDVAAAQLAIWSVIDNGPSDTGTMFTYSDASLSSLVNSDITAAQTAYSQYGNDLYNGVDWIQAPISTSSSPYNHTQSFVYIPGYSSNPNGGIPTQAPEPSFPAFAFSLAVAVGIMMAIKRRSSQTAS